MKDKKRKNRRIGNLFLTTGLLLITAALSLSIYNIWDSNRAEKASGEVAEKLEIRIEEEKDDTMRVLEQMTETEEADREMPTMEIDGHRYIGYLDIPTLGLRLPVMEDWDYDRLKIAPCRYSGTVYKNNLVIAGHNYRRHFSPLRSQGKGTPICFTDVEGNMYSYEISKVEVLKPQQVEDMVEDSEDWDLTLFTCTIGGQTRHTIRCVRTDSES